MEIILLTIFFTWGIANIIGGIILAISIVGYFLFSGNIDIMAMMDLMESFYSDIIFFFISTFVIISISFIFFFISMKYIHKREFMSIVNISGKYDEFAGLVVNWFNRIRLEESIKKSFNMVSLFDFYDYNFLYKES
ncbi:hypothetical protein ALNOE001_19130 [Candidatus Methanobinarius endosymbioticus]|uniref:Uncharacterized protein n=1 Tax=Candidatus Methanobinarius endosymbioticus TaxID=2006182 RepID=A0A366M8W5_9EURY|nr:hypothetical protein ALNOE001_19130 [Candidatus Methanobinarius endosymbioticus]